MSRLKFFAFILITFILFLSWVIYSYTQIDLNLTISSNSIYQLFQKKMIYIGYFDRQLSGSIFLILLCSLFSYYFFMIFLSIRHFISFKQLILLVFLITCILFFAYPAFSHDIYNYMFDARIVTLYHANPYIHTALDFPSDLWTRFMHWTHRTYPYGPVWIFITLPFSFLGFGKFVLTLINFKLMFTFFHLGNIYLIWKILEKIQPKNKIYGVTLFAFNPLVIIESLISPHNEAIMLFFLLLTIYQLISNISWWWILLSGLLSAGIKFITIIIFPILPFYKRLTKKNNMDLFLQIIYVLYITSLIYLFILREPYPWYFIPIVGLSALLPQKRKILYITIALSIGSLLRYVPFLLYGIYTANERYLMNMVFIIPVFSVIILVVINILSDLLFNWRKSNRRML